MLLCRYRVIYGQPVSFDIRRHLPVPSHTRVVAILAAAEKSYPMMRIHVALPVCAVTSFQFRFAVIFKLDPSYHAHSAHGLSK